MKIPKSIEPLVRDGIVDAVLRQLKSGKEATVFVVRAGGDIRCAKVYKETAKRSFHHNAEYQEGRVVRNSRRARAMEKNTRYGRKEREEVWQTAEVDALYRLGDAGVRVPRTYGFFDGVLLMELVTGENGDVAPRLDDLEFTPELARAYHGVLVREVVRMLCAGLIHGDLSEYNVLVDSAGPVIIDLPQAVNAAGNNNAARMLARDVENITQFFGRFAPELLSTEYAAEIWAIYEQGDLYPDTPLTGHFEHSTREADVDGVMREIEAAREEAVRRRERREMSDVDKE